MVLDTGEGEGACPATPNFRLEKRSEIESEEMSKITTFFLVCGLKQCTKQNAILVETTYTIYIIENIKTQQL